ncbi:hypothetical protein NKH18_40140 [Streptomyces sp. M10(2022)]
MTSRWAASRPTRRRHRRDALMLPPAVFAALEAGEDSPAAHVTMGGDALPAGHRTPLRPRGTG